MTVSKKDHMKHFNKQQALSNPINSDQFMTAEVVRHYQITTQLSINIPWHRRTTTTKSAADMVIWNM